MRRLLLAAAAIAAVACAVGPAPIFTPKTAPIPHVGLNAWPNELTPADLRTFVALGAKTLRVPVTSRQQAEDVLTAVDGSPLSVLLLVEHDSDALVRALADLDAPQLAGIELGNELDLAGLSPFQFGNWNVASYNTLKAAGWTKPILAGSVYAVTDDTLQYLHDARRWVGWPSDLITTVHWYQDADDATLERLQHFGALAVTETGLPSRTPSDDAAQAAFLRHMYLRAEQLGAQWWMVYQCCSGPSTSNLDNFGLLHLDRSPKGFTFP